MELKPAELAKEWASGKLRPVYYLIGEDESARSEALAKLKGLFAADPFNASEWSGDLAAQAEALVSECLTLPVFAERRLVLVKSASIPAAARDALAGYLKDPLPTTTLVLQSDDKKPDLKDALVKAAAAAGALCVFAALGEDAAAERLKAAARAAGKTLADDAADALVAEVGPDWGLLKQELDKALLYASGPGIARGQVLETLGYRKAADPFALTRLVQDRRLKESLAHLRRLFLEGKPEDAAFRAMNQASAAVSRQVKAKRMLKAGRSPEAVFRALRLHPYYDRDYLARLSKLTEARLLADLKACLATDAAMKSKSWLDPRIEVERLIATLCS